MCMCVCVRVCGGCQWATCMALDCWMLRAWWRRQSDGDTFPPSMSVWWRLPSSRAGKRSSLPLRASLKSSFFITHYLYPSHFTRMDFCHILFSRTLMGVIFFTSPPSTLLFLVFTSSYLCSSLGLFIIFFYTSLLTELFIQAWCWRLFMRPGAALTSPSSTLFMWSMSLYVLPSLTVAVVTFLLRSLHLQAPCPSCSPTGNWGHCFIQK